MKEITRIKLEPAVADFIEARYEDYRAKQDLLTMIFELHKNDEDDSIIRSVPFKSYEKEFSKAKIEYDTAMTEIAKKYVPQEFRTNKHYFEINFADYEMIINEVE